ncbi:DUF5994 family protein [Dactylosporangium cerinum]|uniref:DUF5994 family protein n=1 Tax=Dactylosporangium cerinum TaxID=1434730 RepID=A0ABV9WDC5_9ACTN
MSLTAVRAARAVLDGGWWPRSRNSVAEVPGSILALDERYGPIRQLMLNSHSILHRADRRTQAVRPPERPGHRCLVSPGQSRVTGRMVTSVATRRATSLRRRRVRRA